MERDARPLPDAAFPAGTIRLCDLPPEQYTALRSALDAAARRERARISAQFPRLAADAVRRLFRRRPFRRDDHQSAAVRLTNPCGRELRPTP